MIPTRRALLFLPLACLYAAKDVAISDDGITDMVSRKLANDPDVKGGALKVTVKDGVVTLNGTVSQDKWRAKAEKLARKVRGVKHVVNNLKVGPPQ